MSSRVIRWCLFRRSSNVRNAIKYQMTKFGYNNKQLAERANIASYRLSNYLRGDKQDLNQIQLMTVCDVLHIDIKVEVSLRLE